MIASLQELVPLLALGDVPEHTLCPFDGQASTRPASAYANCRSGSRMRWSDEQGAFVASGGDCDSATTGVPQIAAICCTTLPG